MREYIQAHVTPAQRVFCNGRSLWSYWIAHRNPPGRFAYMATQTLWFLRNRPQVFLDALADERLSLVEFDPQQIDLPQVDDGSFLQDADRVVLREFLRRIEQAFVPAADSPPGAYFWIRKTQDGKP